MNPTNKPMTAEEILSEHLKRCYETHGVTMPDKFHGYILRAMEEYAQSAPHSPQRARKEMKNNET